MRKQRFHWPKQKRVRCVCCCCARPPALPASLARLPACRASSIGPELIHCAPQVRPPPCPPACFVCLHACVLPLRTPAWSACLPHPPGLRAVRPELMCCARPGAPTSLPACLPVRLLRLSACVCVLLLHARLLCLPPSPAWPACRASSIGPELMRCARQVRPSPCPPACPPACFVCLHVCVPLRTPAWSACLSHPPGLRAVHPALVQSSCTVHARCAHHPRPPACPPACFVCSTCVCCCCTPAWSA